MKSILDAIKLSLIFSLFALAACVDVDLDMAFKPDRQIDADYTISMSKSAYNFAKDRGGECRERDGLVLEMSEESAKCRGGLVTNIDAVKNNLLTPNPELPFDPNDFELTENGKEISLVIPLDYDALLAKAGEEVSPSTLAFSAPLFGGHFVTLSVEAAKIITSNGVISEDEKTATLQIPIDQIMKGGDNLPETFTATFLID